MNALTRQAPPRKQAGQGLGPRAVNGALMDVRTAAAFLGTTEKTLRGMIDRQLVPFRRFNSRVVFLRSELDSFLVGLPGCSLDQARANAQLRQGIEG